MESDNTLHLYFNGVDQGIAAKDLPNICYALVDVYGQCQQVGYLYHKNKLEFIVG